MLVALTLAAAHTAAAQPVAPAPASQPAGPRPFQPGVQIDWRRPAVIVDARVVLREGPLEFAACFGGKEHESILRLEATAAAMYAALGLIGLEPGRPSEWLQDQQRFTAPRGDLVRVEVQTSPDGASVDLFTWLLDAETLQPPPARPWVFAGSREIAGGGLLADRSGAGLALVDFSDSLLALTRRHGSSDANLWAFANPSAIPPENTPVRLIFSAPSPLTLEFHLGSRGEMRRDGRPIRRADALDLIAVAARIPGSPPAVLTTDARLLRSDRLQFEADLRRAEISPAAVAWRAAPRGD